MTAKYRASISFLAALVAAMVAAMPAFSQEQHTAELSKVVRLNRAPVSNETLQVTLPKPVVTKLPNGLHRVGARTTICPPSISFFSSGRAICRTPRIAGCRVHDRIS